MHNLLSTKRLNLKFNENTQRRRGETKLWEMTRGPNHFSFGPPVELPVQDKTIPPSNHHECTIYFPLNDWTWNKNTQRRRGETKLWEMTTCAVPQIIFLLEHQQHYQSRTTWNHQQQTFRSSYSPINCYYLFVGTTTTVRCWWTYYFYLLKINSEWNL